MEKSKKKFGAKIAAALVAVTALTCCFVGSTFARYTSSTEATGTVTVAKWQVTGISANTDKINAFEFDTANAKLSPAELGTEASTANLTNEVLSTAITIQNLSDVEADITYAWKENAVVYNWRADGDADTSNDITNATEYKSAADNGGTAITYKDLADGVFTWSVWTCDTEDGTYVEWKKGDADTTLPAKTLAKDATLYVKVKLVWKTGANDDRDEIDTILGMYLENVKNTLTLTATQGSQLPTA